MAILFCAKYLVYIIVLMAGIYWLTLPKKQKVQMLIFGLVAGLVAFIFTRAGGHFYFNPRPFVTPGVTPIYPHPANNGFPSDHTALAMVVAVTVLYISRKWGYAFLGLACLVGFARVAGHIHNPVDVIGSILFVAVAGLLAYLLTPKIMLKIKQLASP